jgi:hypothetical protein
MATVTASYNWVSGETVTPTKLNSTAAPTVVVADNEVTTAKILDANVTNAKLASDIDASKLTTGTLPIARIADDAVTNDKLSLAANAGEIKKALNADNLPPIFACRAWVNFDGNRDVNGLVSAANTARLIRSSGNVTSVTRTGVGQYTINFTTAMPDGSYCATFGGRINSELFLGFIDGSKSATGSELPIVTRNSAGNSEADVICVSVFR